MEIQVLVVLARLKGPILLWHKEERRSLGRFQRNYPSGFQMFLDEGFACLHFHWVEQIDLGDLGSEVGMKFDCVVVGVMGRELIMGFLGEDILEVLALFRYSWFDRSSSLGYLGRDGGFINLFSI